MSTSHYYYVVNTADYTVVVHEITLKNHSETSRGVLKRRVYDLQLYQCSYWYAYTQYATALHKASASALEPGQLGQGPGWGVGRPG